MPKLFEITSPAASPEGGELPYRLEVQHADGGSSLVAMTHSASLGFACYYAALREYSEGRLTLSCDGRTLASVRAG
jgi:hypothetical protein